ncbi:MULTISPECIES: universal stress protein [unclassified Rubrivivax]|uniref:universal stress protein n=1 Tax=unclassified Rubrivivax TaxID=2649762 RepID=UPI001E44F276|nr:MULTISPECIES: universal stress protein [unclassified Rubrivivax]MCC9598277.1 universal stress protein [Rubrivivax sp. JA1055]MCC9645467.1 universal stress protein [Rubrivivax sp. JA1029]
MKSILVHLDASPRSATRLALAHRLARQHGAQLTAVFAVLPAIVAVPFAAAEGAYAAASLLEETDRQLRARAREMFEREAVSGVPMQWFEIRHDTLEVAVVEHALFADLLVLGQHDPDDREAGPVPRGLVATLVHDSGKPALVLPFQGEFGAPVRRVLIAWKPTPEAARAVAAARPWLLAAEEVHVACTLARRDDERTGVAALERWLRASGVTAPIRSHGLAGTGIGEALLSVAADTDADLLVMGCYGHSRARELVLGGVTRTVLRSMTLPVLMAH